MHITAAHWRCTCLFAYWAIRLFTVNPTYSTESLTVSRTFIVSLLGGALLLMGTSLVINNRLHSQVEQQLNRIDAQQVEIATLKLQRLFNRLKFDLSQRSNVYTLTHNKIEQIITSSPTTDIAKLKTQISMELGFEIDIFLVNPELVVTDSTYAPDIGLDFKQPFFLDAQAAFEEAKQTRRLVLGHPTLEIISLSYKIYTVSMLQDGSYLEVGFIDPQVAKIYSAAQDTIMAEQGLLSIEFYVEANGESLSPLTQLMTFEPTVSKHRDKSAYLQLVKEYLQAQHGHFKELPTGGYSVLKRPGKPDESFFYIVLDEATMTPSYQYRIIGKLHVKRETVTWWEEHANAIAMLLALLTLLLIVTALWQSRRVSGFEKSSIE